MTTDKWSVVLNDSLQATLNPPLRLQNTHRYSVTLVSGEFNYSWDNISVALGNNTFSYSTDGVMYVTVTIPAGTWSSCELVNFITDAVGIANITIQILYYNAKWKITMNNGYFFDTGTMGTMIGFENNEIIPPATPTPGSSSTNFMGKVKAINILCNLVDNVKNHHNKGNSNILFSRATPVVNPYDRINLVSTIPVSVMAAPSSGINNISINILDQDLHPIKLNDKTSTFWIEIADEGHIPGASKPVAST